MSLLVLASTEASLFKRKRNKGIQQTGPSGKGGKGRGGKRGKVGRVQCGAGIESRLRAKGANPCLL